MTVITRRLSLPRGQRLGLLVLLLGGFVTVFDLFVVNVAIPIIQADFSATYGEIGFIVAGYELAFGALLIIGGRLGDRYGRRRLFSLGMLAFAVTSGLCGVAPSIELLMVARVLQGGAAALLFPQIYALLRVLYDEVYRQRAFSLLGMMLGLAAILGQVLGGMIIEADLLGSGWRMIFLLNLPLGIAAAWGAAGLPESRLETAEGLDLPGTLLASIGLLLLLVPLLEGPTRGWPIWTWCSLAGSALLGGLFMYWEWRLLRRQASPLIDLRLFGQGLFGRGMLAVLAIYSTSTSLFLCFALLLQTGMGLSPLQAGLLFAPASVAFVAASMLAPRLVRRWGQQVLVMGTVMYALGIAGLMVLAGSGEGFALLSALVVLGFGQALVMTPLLNLLLSSVAEQQAGMAAAVMSTGQQVGGALGVAVVGVLFVPLLGSVAGDTPQGILAQYATAFSGAMFYNLLALLVAGLLLHSIVRGRP